jgi:hypothetical protein|tara:strand:+ start:118 stop:249 length:132 start_codon:yes stop_codon:yes gene_type:complete
MMHIRAKKPDPIPMEKKVKPVNPADAIANQMKRDSQSKRKDSK